MLEAQKCWEFFGCLEEAKKNCPACPDHGRECWKVLPTQDHKKTRSPSQLYCLTKCDWYKKLNPQ